MVIIVAIIVTQARHAGYTALQESLWQRSHDRAVARSDPAGRAALNKSLMQHLDTSHGKLAPGWIPGRVCVGFMFAIDVTDL